MHALLVATAIVMLWRGAWGLLDNYLFPDNQILSFSVSLIIGIGLLFIISGRRLDSLE